ncbi:hypothetical protein ACFLRZ_04350 [Bacteroidota bacterium]
MKRALKIFIISAFLILSPLVITHIFAQVPPPPPPDGSGGGTPIGGTAPIGSGLIVMMVMGTAYGSKKIYNAFK